MPDLQAGTVVTGTDATIAVEASENTSQGPTSTSFAAGSPVCGVAFDAPITGRCVIYWSAVLDNNTVNQDTVLSIEVRAGATIGSGTVLLSPQDQIALINESTNELRGSMFYPIDDLDPGLNYNVRLMHRVTGGTGTVNNRRVNVIPLP